MVKSEIIVAASPNSYMKITWRNDLKFWVPTCGPKELLSLTLCLSDLDSAPAFSDLQQGYGGPQEITKYAQVMKLPRTCCLSNTQQVLLKNTQGLTSPDPVLISNHFNISHKTTFTGLQFKIFHGVSLHSLFPL